MTEQQPEPVLESEANKIRLTHEYQYSREMRQSAHETAHATLKALMILNGGAVIGIITFLGNYADAEKAGLKLDFADIKGAIAIYLAGLSAGVLAFLLGYIGQDCGHASRHEEAAATYASMRDGVDADRSGIRKYYIATSILLGSAIVSCVIALVCFVAGSWRAVLALG